MQHVIVIGALPESLLNFRGDLIRALVAKDCKVTAMAASTEADVVSNLADIGVSFKAFPVQRNGLNPAADLKTLFALCKAFQELQPDVLLAYTIKPIIWSGLASRTIPETRFYALVTGLGFAFQGNSPVRKLLSKLVSGLYRISLRRATKVIFQNPDNLLEFVSRRIVPGSKCVLVNGSGVDTRRFAYAPLPDGNITFLSIGRLLGEKGFREYAQAAEVVKAKYPGAVFQLLGQADPSPDGIPMAEVQRWHQQGGLEYLGATDDVRPFLQNCHIYVLPSYHEGMPRTVLEAMATGRAILTTDVPGCRETVIPGENGYLVSKANVTALAERMIWFIENRDQWGRMGQTSRRMAEERFDVHKINAEMLQIMGLDNGDTRW